VATANLSGPLIQYDSVDTIPLSIALWYVIDEITEPRAWELYQFGVGHWAGSTPPYRVSERAPVAA